MNWYILVDFCECDAHTRRIPSVGLAKAHPNDTHGRRKMVMCNYYLIRLCIRMSHIIELLL